MTLKGPPSIFFDIQDKSPARQFGPMFGFFGYCKREYLTLRDLDMTPTYAAPGLFLLQRRRLEGV